MIRTLIYFQIGMLAYAVGRGIATNTHSTLEKTVYAILLMWGYIIALKLNGQI